MVNVLSIFRIGKENTTLREENQKLREELVSTKQKCQENINAVNRYYKGKLKNTFRPKISQ